MARLKLGVVLEALGKPFRSAVPLAGKLGLQGVQLDAVGEFHPDKLSQTGRREVRHVVTTHQLEITTVSCPLRSGLDTQDQYENRIGHVKKVMQLAYDLGPRVVLISAGEVPADEKSLNYTLLRNALADLARHGDRIGVKLAMEAGYEPVERLKALLSGMETGGLAVTIDPATAVLQRLDPAQMIRDLAPWVEHVHARDARPGRADRSGGEVPLGTGRVEWTAVLSALEEIGYRSWLTIKRGPVPDPLTDLKAAVAFLRTLIG